MCAISLYPKHISLSKSGLFIIGKLCYVVQSSLNIINENSIECLFTNGYDKKIPLSICKFVLQYIVNKVRSLLMFILHLMQLNSSVLRNA